MTSKTNDRNQRIKNSIVISRRSNRDLPTPFQRADGKLVERAIESAFATALLSGTAILCWAIVSAVAQRDSSTARPRLPARPQFVERGLSGDHHVLLRSFRMAIDPCLKHTTERRGIVLGVADAALHVAVTHGHEYVGQPMSHRLVARPLDD